MTFPTSRLPVSPSCLRLRVGIATLLGISLVCCAGTNPKAALKTPLVQTDAPQPPIAPRHPVKSELHGDTRIDDYAWLRNKGSAEVLAYLQAENAYTDARTQRTIPLQDTLYQEIIGRIQQTDQTPPVRRGRYLYYSRTTQDQQYPVYCRKLETMDATEEVLLDLNALAQGEAFLALGDFEVSDDANLLAYSLDTTGFRQYTLHVKDLRSGKVLPDTIAKVTSVAWAADGRTLLYTVEDAAKRSYRLYRHVLGGGEDPLVYEEKDERFSLEVSRTRSKAYLLLTSGSHTASEVRFVSAGTPEQALRLVAARREQHEYYVDQRGELFYIRTNDRGRNFRVVTTQISAPDESQWHELVATSPNVMLEDLAVFDHFFVVHEREDGVPQLRVTELAPDAPDASAPTPKTKGSRRVELPEPVYEIYADDNPEPATDRYRFSYESLTTPTTYYDYHVADHTLEVVKRKAVLGGYDPARYDAQRTHVRAADGTLIPVSLVEKKGLGAGPHPMLLTGYGSYGYPLPATFSYARVSLLDRGVVVAIAHVRGGGELGKRWHDEGRMLNKQNTFSDFIAVAEQMIRDGRTAPDRLAIEGGSAGGLLIGAVVNARPELFKAALLDVPFVDVINTMSDPSLPLTVGEYEEWGNPNNADEYRAMRAYSPYDNIRAVPYPALLVETSYNDSQVMYWEPAKYVAKLRVLNTGKQPPLLRVNMQAGHGGASGRYDQLHERAFDFAFLLGQITGKP